MQSDVRIRFLLICILAVTGGVCKAQDQASSSKDLPAPFIAAEFKKHVAYLASDELAGRAPGSDGSAKAATYVIRQFEVYGLTPLRENGSWFQEFPLKVPDPTSGSITAKNILAVLPGQGDLSREAIIVCAHYDHLGSKSPGGRGAEDTIYNGADDNASGVAALLLVAKAMAGKKASLPESHRTILFASFDAEEQGLLGAEYYVQRPVWPLDRTAAVLNFDAMGRLRLGKFFASDVETNPMLAEAVRAAARERQIIAETRYGGHGRSDHAVFLEQGIPGMHFFTGANSDYHRVTDHWEGLNFDGGANIAWIGYQALLKAMTYPDRIEYQKLDPSFDMTFLLNLVQTLGIVPNVNAQEGRYPQILLVIPNSPAAKHGLQSGDQITSINGLPFNRVEDGLTIFQQLTLEDGVRVSVLRDGRTSDVNIPASVFEKMSGPKATRLENGQYEVEFRYQAATGVETVYLVGEFNAWHPMDHQMDGPGRDGMFTTRLELDAGAYEYKFVIEGKEWKSDPQNLYRVGKHDNSVLWVGTRPR
jgi:hypothetical protein